MSDEQIQARADEAEARNHVAGLMRRGRHGRSAAPMAVIGKRLNAVEPKSLDAAAGRDLDSMRGKSVLGQLEA